MPTTLQFNAIAFKYTRNPIVVAMAEGETDTNYRVTLYSETQYHDGEDVDVPVAEVVRTTDSTGSFSVRIDDILDSYLGKDVALDFPDPDASDMQFARYLMRRFQCAAVELDVDGEETGEPIETSIDFCIYGGIAYELWPGIYETTTEFVEADEFRNIKESFARAGSTFPAYACWLASADNNTPFTFESDTTPEFTSTQTPTFLQGESIVLITVPVWAVGAAEDESFTYYLQRDSEVELAYGAVDVLQFDAENLQCFGWLNGKGSFETIVATGNQTGEIDVRADTSESFLPDDLSQLNQMRVSHTRGMKNRTASVGYELTLNVGKLSTSFLLSKHRFLLYQNRWIPIVIRTSKYRYADANSQVMAFEFEYMLAFETVGVGEI